MGNFYIAFLGGEPCQDMRAAAGPFETADAAAAAEPTLDQAMLKQGAPPSRSVIGEFFAMEVNGRDGFNAVIGPYKTLEEAEQGRQEEAAAGAATFANTDGFLAVVRFVKQAGPRSTQVVILEGLTAPESVDKSISRDTLASLA